MSSRQEKRYLYKLVEFPDDENDSLSIDIVPGQWIFYDDVAGELMCRYMDGDMTEKKKKELRKMTQKGQPANLKWPTHRVEVKGRAQTYKDAKKGIKKLHTNTYAYSTDDEIKCQEKAAQEKKEYRRARVSTTPGKSVEALLETAQVDLTKSPQEQVPNDSPASTEIRV